MDFELTEAQREWRDELRSFVAENVTEALRQELRNTSHEGVGPEMLAFRRKVGRKRWYGLTWPLEYGGLARTALDHYMLMSEFEYAGVQTDIAVTAIAPIILRCGTEDNKRDFLPGILHGETSVALGYSEPEAGTDLASLKTRAELYGDEWVINGSKIWNSVAHTAKYQWLCARTDPHAARHQGISVIMVPTDCDGITIQPLISWSDFRTNHTFFTDVRVPRRNLIGEVNMGWQYITGALDLERGAITSAGRLRCEVDGLIDLCRSVSLEGGSRLLDKPEVRQRLAELDADVEVARLFGVEAVSQIANGESPTITLTAEKIYTSELRQKIADFGTQMLGMYGQLDWRDSASPGGGSMERLYREAPLLRFGGGANEVLRDVLAQRGHGMPSYGRSART